MLTRFVLIFLFLFLAKACEEESKMTFSETNLLFEKNSVVEINIPNAEGKSEAAQKIQRVIEQHILEMLDFSESTDSITSIEAAVEKFESEYNAFRTDIAEDAMSWEAVFDGDIVYQSSEVITVAINSYLNTGGAHGNMNITLYNFNTSTGDLLQNEDLIEINQKFQSLAELHFKKEIDQKGGDINEYFFDEGFSLPANIGLNDDGLLLLYNTYEIGAYALGITEFTIPFDEVDPFLKLF